MILMPDLSGDLSRMFSGLRSQWIICYSRRYLRAWSIWIANRLIKERDTPWKLLFLMNS